MGIDSRVEQEWLDAEARRLLSWAGKAAHPAGGFGWLDSSGSLVPSRGRPLWVNCRMVHCLALGQLAGIEGSSENLVCGVRTLLDSFRDRANGGFFADADHPGTGRKDTYGHAFVVLAGSTVTVAGVSGGEDLLALGLEAVNGPLWDAEAAMPVDSSDLSFKEVDPYRGGNASMHLVEALLAAADATGELEFASKALTIVDRLVPIAEDYGWRMPEHYDANWRVVRDYNIESPRDPFRPYGVTPGHALEWARLMAALAGYVPERSKRLLGAAHQLAATAVSDGWDRDLGGFVYTTDFEGLPVVRERFHWVVCEAIGAAWAMARTTQGSEWLDRYSEYWQWARTYLIDPAHPGGWRHELSARNEPVAVTWTDRPDVYHALQATLLPPLSPSRGLALSLRERSREEAPGL